MQQLKKFLFSERGMQLVNVLFLLSTLFRGLGIIFIAYVVWIVYLVCCRKQTHSKTMRWVYGALILYAAVILLLNTYFLITAL